MCVYNATQTQQLVSQLKRSILHTSPVSSFTFLRRASEPIIIIVFIITRPGGYSRANRANLRRYINHQISPRGLSPLSMAVATRATALADLSRTNWELRRSKLITRERSDVASRRGSFGQQAVVRLVGSIVSLVRIRSRLYRGATGRRNHRGTTQETGSRDR